LKRYAGAIWETRGLKKTGVFQPAAILGDDLPLHDGRVEIARIALPNGGPWREPLALSLVSGECLLRREAHSILLPVEDDFPLSGASHRGGHWEFEGATGRQSGDWPLFSEDGGWSFVIWSNEPEGDI
jgi:hypothetical protein